MSMQYEVNFNAAAMINAIESLKALGMSGGGSGGNNDDLTALKAEAETQTKAIVQTQPFLRRLFKSTGIQFNMASLLKQSQIFTGTVGSIFQIFGALVDVILAPFLPIILPAIRFMAAQIPLIHKIVKTVADFLISTFSPGSVDNKVDGWISGFVDKFLGFLPQNWQTWLKENLTAINWGTVLWTGLGAMLLLKFGFLGKLLAPVKWLLKIPLIALMLKPLGKFIPGLNKLLAPKAAAKGAAGKAAAAAGKQNFMGVNQTAAARTGMFGGKMGGFLKTAGKFGKFGLKAIPGLGAGLLAIQGGIQTYKTVAEGLQTGKGWQASLKAGAAVAGTTAGAMAISTIPGVGGIVGGVGGALAIDAVANKMADSLAKAPVVVKVTVDGEEKLNQQLQNNETATTDMQNITANTQPSSPSSIP